MFLDCDKLYLDVKSAPSFDEFNALELQNPIDPDDEENEFAEDEGYEAGGPSEIVIIRAFYQWPVSPIITPLYSKHADYLSLANIENGKRLIGAFAAFRNEPYN